MSQLLDARALTQQLPDWEASEVDGELRLSRTFKFDDFKAALAFTNQVGDLAETHNHHPLLHLTWGKLTVEWWSHDAGGVTAADVTMAKATDGLV